VLHNGILPEQSCDGDLVSLTAVAKKHGISRASVCRIAKLRALTADGGSPSAPGEGRLSQTLAGEQFEIAIEKTEGFSFAQGRETEVPLFVVPFRM
jgi:hypothetical protein